MTCTVRQQAAKRKIHKYLKDSGVPCLLEKVSNSDLNHRYTALTNKRKGKCWLALYLGADSKNGKGIFIHLYSRDPSCMNDLRFSRYCMLHSDETRHIRFLQEDPFRPYNKTRDMGRIEQEKMSWRNLGEKELEALKKDYIFLMQAAHESIGEFPDFV